MSVIQLAEPETRRQRHERLRERMPELARWTEENDHLHGNPDDVFGQLRATRSAARRFVSEHPEVDGPVELDCQWIEAVTPPFISELLIAWPQATFVNCNEDVAATIQYVQGPPPSGPCTVA